MNLLASPDSPQNNEPLVSVCVPVYNHEKFVEECLQSIINQSYQRIELIVIDDGSKDGSVEVIRKLIHACEDRFVRFKLISRSNKGLCKTLNEAINWCQGDFFSAVASDDAWYPEKISTQLKVFGGLNADVAVISSELQPIDESGKVFGYVNVPEHGGIEFNFEDVIYGRSRIPAPAAMIKMDILRDVGGYAETTMIEDLYMWLSLTKRGYKIYISPQVLAKYRTHGENSHKKVRLMHKHTVELISQFSPDNVVREKALKINIEHAFFAAAIFDKSYAIRIMIEERLNIFKRNMIAPMIFLMTPKILMPYVLNIGRRVKRLLS